MAEAKHEKLQMDQKLKHSTRKCEERGNEEQKFLEEINKVNGELRKCRENYSSLESENSRILVSEIGFECQDGDKNCFCSVILSRLRYTQKWKMPRSFNLQWMD